MIEKMKKTKHKLKKKRKPTNIKMIRVKNIV